ncbi:MAG TPA: FAD-dependent oxidoreductase [Oscillospiraceae bacterium]|nr:FAD-dependent oxidoreductase [Oscillospiraceae bacterium]HPF55075.1 FAD-dependent oxidoreductase [Clostridiales bacterium]HPK34892.1 FAD-dependent oxidoreductase [Oscillospiraceae bacterium]HPR76144.1 FAD-dependent oxidoreductase [Oscillospiraceae bacterium]
MDLKNIQLAVIGAGPAGMSAARAAWENGVRNIVILERGSVPGGILPQCIHNGFGLHRFKEELTGPEYAQKDLELLKETGVEILCDTMVLSISPDRRIDAVGKKTGYLSFTADAIILAMGCRERTAGAISLAGSRPSGVFSAGTAQRYINIEGYMVGKKAVILGSGDIGLIMARRMTLEGAKVEAVVELMPYSNGLTRNVVQCLEDYNIPLYLSHTVTKVHGNARVSGVTIAKVDENRMPILSTEFDIDCDTLLLSVGLIPENELSKTAGVALDPRTNGAVVDENMQTEVEGVFACGNVLHVHDLVDFVSAEGERAGKSAADYLKNGAAKKDGFILVKNGFGVGYTVPQRIATDCKTPVTVFFRVNRVFKNSEIVITDENGALMTFKRERMAPGEMERIVLSPDKLQERREITVFIRENR